MVGGTAHPPQQAPQVAPPSSSSSSTVPTTTPEEDELLKRNTDCVYFLASPLTCKKGSECEYRHSDIARVNPRDCWYWLNGNCLNPKCAFRHPPLDGVLGADVTTPMGPSLPAVPHAAPYAITPKQGVACIFFQKGFCLKGHLCPFLHTPPNSVNNKPSQSGLANPVTEPPKMAHSGPEKSIQEQKFAKPATVQKPVTRAQPPIAARNGGNGAVDEKVPPPPKSMRVVPPLVMNGTPENNRVMSRNTDEYSREPSPGFDVLVDNELEDSEYYHNKEEFVIGRSTGHEYHIDHSNVDQEMYRGHRDFDHYNERDGHFAYDDRRASSERMLVESAHSERRQYPRNNSPDHYNDSDLRHRISKRRGSDLEHSHENHTDRMPRRDRHYHHDDHRRLDHHRQDRALSDRLRGRIKIPGRSISPTNENKTRMEREREREREMRYSPGRPLSLNQSRIRDRIKDNNNDSRDYKTSRGHRDMMFENGTNFAAPKRLSELKTGRTNEGSEQILGKRKYPRAESRQSEENFSFEGPKPLSEILKRKRGVEIETRVSSTENNSKQENVVESKSMVVTKKEEHEHENDSVSPDLKAEKQTGSSNIDKDKSWQSYDEGGLMDDDALLDEELEAYDQNDGDYEYDQIDGEEEYNLDEGEYVDEEEDGKKDSVVYS